MRYKIKTCTKCKLTQPIYEFNKDSTKLDGHALWCNNCMRNWHKDNTDFIFKMK